MRPRIVALALLSTSPVPAGQAATGVELENDRVRVIRPRYGPGDSTPMHEHPDRVIVPLTDGRVEQSFADGRVTAGEVKAGEVRYTPPTRHAVRNLGDAGLELVEVEIKPVSPPGRAAPAELVTRGSGRLERVLENGVVRVSRLVLGAGEAAAIRELGDAVVVALTASRTRVAAGDGGAREAVRDPGAVDWRPAGSLAVENLGDRPIQLLVVELKGSS